MIFIFLFNFRLFSLSASTFALSVLCTEDFCRNYLEQVGCENLGIACRIQNQTINGEIFDAPTPCNCCKTCIQNLFEGDICTIGSPDMPPPNIVCGPGLICAADNTSPDGDYRCKKMDHTQCFRDQIKYDTMKNSNDGVGSFIQRPECNGDGQYSSVKCNLGQMCYCVDEQGKRIFGEAPYRPLIEKTMKCECSRLNTNFNKWMMKNVNENNNNNYPLPTVRCLEDGSFDPMQCIDNKCICVEEQTGAEKTNNFNMSSITYDKLPCFNKTIHSKYSYLHDCETMQWNLINELKESEENDFIVLNNFMDKFPICQADGWFPPVKETETSLICVDKYGRKIDNYEILKISTSESQNMNCNCARTRNVLIQNLGKYNSTGILPQCCSNGNFQKVQCRKEFCYCSDENGLQIDKEKHISNISALNCYNGGNFC